MKDEGRNDLRERTKQFSLRAIRLYASLPKTAEAQVMGKQVLRSATSVGANYHEAYRGRSRSEFIAKVGDSLREIEETSYWFDLLVESGVVPSDQLDSLRKEAEELTAILVAIVKKAKSGKRS